MPLSLCSVNLHVLVVVLFIILILLIPNLAPIPTNAPKHIPNSAQNDVAEPREAPEPVLASAETLLPEHPQQPLVPDLGRRGHRLQVSQSRVLYERVLDRNLVPAGILRRRHDRRRRRRQQVLEAGVGDGLYCYHLDIGDLDFAEAVGQEKARRMGMVIGIGVRVRIFDRGDLHMGLGISVVDFD
ncbi:unnamed protein product [Prunus brigantina]